MREVDISQGSKKRVYSSNAMLARRERILAVTRTLLAEKGLNFSVRELCISAGVAQQTFYDAFGDKRGAITQSIIDFADIIKADHLPNPPSTDVRGALDEYDYLVKFLQLHRMFTKASVEIYFDAKTESAFRQSIAQLPHNRMHRCLSGLKRKNALLTGLDDKQLIDDFVELELLIYRRWLAGRIGDDQVRSTFKANFLFILLAATIDPARAEIAGLYREHSGLARLSSPLEKYRSK